ncbi:uncharacterized protein LOC121182387 [Toxotes jaculatrix]|uniref:uncharacterized protein LOC121182387 n=1 Tax=Toxotes jaculatrix TaxID=941984 RepID=UPI001B3B0234|nr:uncharacterized protein LOC121182387 [Toxotes jaculatrix]
MTESQVVLDALSTLFSAVVTSIQSEKSQGSDSTDSLSADQKLTIATFMTALIGGLPALGASLKKAGFSQTCKHIIDEEEFLDPDYDYDFTDVKDTQTFYRGGEVYERPCGWKRYALKVLDKYRDGNAWLGERGHCTTTHSEDGEWPVAYHGTSRSGARGIITDQFKPGPGQKYGRGIYCTPYLSEATPYTEPFSSTSKGREYQVVLQIRVNPKYREKHNKGKYWLVPIKEGLTEEEEQEIVDKAVRPYAILMRRL